MAPEKQMTRARKNSIDEECDLCARRKTRLKVALMQVEYVRKKSLETPAISDGYAFRAAEVYLEEVLSSHPEHRMPSCPEAKVALSASLNFAVKYLEYVRKKSLEDPALFDGLVLGEAERRVDELRFSHPEHRMPPGPEDPGAQSTGREDYQSESGDQRKQQRAPQSDAEPEAKSTVASGKARREKPSIPKESPDRSKSDGTNATRDTDTEKALKTAFFNQLDVMDKMTLLEDKLGIITPGGHKQMNALVRLAGAILKEELKRRK
jgi:hypothetical protein